MTTTLAVEPVEIPTGLDRVRADLRTPATPAGLVVFAHASGSSRFNPHNQHEAELFADAGLATLLVDLFTPSEEAVDEYTERYRFDIERLAHRLSATVDWAAMRPPLRDLPLGCFGAFTGAAAALVAAADRPASVSAVVSRGGRPDLAYEALPRVQAPTLLIVGESDLENLERNRQAMQQMRSAVQLEILPGAMHSSAVLAGLDRASLLAMAWFQRYLACSPASSVVVSRHEWAAFLADFSRRHRGWLTTVRTSVPGAPPQQLAAARPLESIEPIRDQGRIAALEIGFGDGDLPPSVVVLSPEVLRVEETPRGGERGLEVEDRYGLRTTIRFRATALPQEVDGVAGTEL